MIFRRAHSLAVGMAVVAVVSSRAFASADLPPLGLPETISVATPTRPTRESEEHAPAGLSRDDAYAVAVSAAAASGRNITIARVLATGSMKPYFDENSLLLLEASPFESLKLGDIVTYYHPDIKQVVAHRLVEKRGNKFWSRGDHNAGMDNVYVTKENYQRRLVGVIYMEPGRTPAPVIAPVPAQAMIAGGSSPAKSSKVTATPKVVSPAVK